MRKCLVNSQFEIILPDHRADRPEWYTPEGWERARLYHMSKNIKKNDIVYYVGAEEGEMPALCTMWGAQLVLFEPNPRVWPNIKAIWDANKLTDPWTFCGFASDKTNDLAADSLNLGWPKSADGAVIGDHGFMNLHEIDPATTAEITIDDIVYDRQLPPPTVISIDTEGSEWRVLLGAKRVLEEHKPRIYLSGHPEFMYANYGTYLSDLRNWIKAFGYIETFLDYQHEVHLYYEAAE